MGYRLGFQSYESVALLADPAHRPDTVSAAPGWFPGPRSASGAAGGPGGGGRGMGGGMGGPQNSLVAIAAQVLGLDQTDLVATLNSGKTIADVAEEKGVAQDKIVDAFVAARKAAMDQAVASGRMTQGRLTRYSRRCGPTSRRSSRPSSSRAAMVMVRACAPAWARA